VIVRPTARLHPRGGRSFRRRAWAASTVSPHHTPLRRHRSPDNQPLDRHPARPI